MTDMPATPDPSAPATELAKLQRQLRRNPEADVEPAAAAAWRTHPDDFDTAVFYFQQLKRNSRFAHAEELLQARLAVPEPTLTDYLIYADLLMKMGLFQESWEMMEQAQSLPGATNFRPLRRFEAAHAQYHPGLDESAVFARLREHGRWLSEHSDALPTVTPRERSASEPIRVGIYSPHFKHHPTAIFAYSSFHRENADEFEWYFYHDSPDPDNAMTQANRQRAHHWRPIRALSSQAAAEQMRADQLDMLIDLCGFLSPGRPEIMLHRPAPVQISWQGWPGTTGLDCYDWRLSDAIADPPGDADRYSTERVYRLPHGHHCYVSPFEYPPITPPPCLHNGYVTFGSANTLIKYSDEVLRAWAAILQRVPHSRLRLRRDILGDAYCRERHLRRFDDAGLPRDRLDLMPFPSVKKVNQHLDFYNLIDMALDPFPYNGMTTTTEPLLMGVPVVALRGLRHSARVSASMLSRVGLDDWVADSLDDYINIAVRQATDLAGLFDLREALRDRFHQSPLGDEAQFQEDMKTALREIWAQKSPV